MDQVEWTVYLMTNRARRSFYCGVTDDLLGEVKLHRTRRAGYLVGKRHLTHLLWRKAFSFEDEAKARCLEIRSWSHKKKSDFVAQSNPQFECILAASRRLSGQKPARLDWRELAQEGVVGPDGPAELSRQ